MSAGVEESAQFQDNEALAVEGADECAIHGEQTGEPYAKGKADETPPCGVKYLRSFTAGSRYGPGRAAR